MLVVLLTALTLGPAVRLTADTGHDLWLRYVRVEDVKQSETYRRVVSSIVVSSNTPTGRLIATEIQRGLHGLLGVDPPMAETVKADGAIVIGTPANSPLIASLPWSERFAWTGDEGYLIRSATLAGHTVTVIASRREIGALYGVFHFLRLIQTGQPIRPAGYRTTASPGPPVAEPLGQPRSEHRARLRRFITVVVDRTAGADRSADR